MRPQMQDIRNFCVIAHVDHGKSTLADCFIRTCGGLSEREMVDQVLDSMDLERERGITIKAQTATLRHTGADGRTRHLNLIDTPGHADFSYEVSRSMCACEGALLVVDAAQGVEAQTLANCYKAIEQGLEIVPVLNKIDLPAADPDLVASQVRDIIGLPADNLLACSAKTGAGVDELLTAVVERVPPPAGDPQGALQALVVDSYFDPYSGVVTIVRVVNGTLKAGDRFRFMSTGAQRAITGLGQFRPRATEVDELGCGEVGYIVAGIKDLSAAKVGDTITLAERPAASALPGFRQVKPQMYAGYFPIEASMFNQFREAFERLCLSDSSLEIETENSPAFGHGIRCGFLGLLHMEIVQERLLREHNVESIITAPSVPHEVELTDGSVITIRSASELPPAARIRKIFEPMADVTIMSPAERLGGVIQLCMSARGEQAQMGQSGSQAVSHWRIPLAQLVMGFVDRLKSVSQGYASMDYELAGYREADIVKVDILVNEDRVGALSMLTPRAEAERRGREVLLGLKESIPRQQFRVPLQAVIGGKIIAREDIRARRKNVVAKCYGGDVTRKKKLLERQRRGKRRMRMFGNVEIPQEAFLAVLQKDVGNG